MTARELALPSASEVHVLADRLGIVIGDPRFLMVERIPELALPLVHRGIHEDLSDWLIALVRVLDAEPDARLFPLISRVAYLSIRHTFGGIRLSEPALRTLTGELHEAFVILRHGGDKYEARAAFVLALLHATRNLH